MKDFETFKKQRQKDDPLAVKMSDDQWQEAYAAYRKSRKRVAGQRSDRKKQSEKRKSSRRRRGKSSSRSSPNNPHSDSKAAMIRRIRAESSYRELRILVDGLAWVAAGLILLGLLIEMLYPTAAAVLSSAILTTALQLIAVFGLRAMFQVLADVADLSLHSRRRGRSSSHSGQTGEQE